MSELVFGGRFELFLSSFTLEEAAGVLVRKFGWDEERSEEASADYLATGDRRHLPPLEEHRRASIVIAPRFLSTLGD